MKFQYGLSVKCGTLKLNKLRVLFALACHSEDTSDKISSRRKEQRHAANKTPNTYINIFN